MKRHVLLFLCAANVFLALGLVAIWFDKDGALRNAHWQAPDPIATDYLSTVPLLPARIPVETGRVFAMLERPLFSPTRRPPPPPPPPSAEQAPVDNLSTARLLGIFQGAQASGIIIQIDGKNRRVRLNEGIDGWLLQSIQGRTVTFAGGGQTRTLQLTRASVSAYTGMAAAPASTAAPVGAPPSPMPFPAQNTPSGAGSAPANPAASAPRVSRFGP